MYSACRKRFWIAAACTFSVLLMGTARAQAQPLRTHSDFISNSEANPFGYEKNHFSAGKVFAVSLLGSAVGFTGGYWATASAREGRYDDGTAAVVGSVVGTTLSVALAKWKLQDEGGNSSTGQLLFGGLVGGALGLATGLIYAGFNEAPQERELLVVTLVFSASQALGVVKMAKP